MYKTKKILAILLAIILLVNIGSVFAQSRFGTQLSAAVQENTAALLPAGTWVYSIKIYADAANSFMGIYNSATLGACTNATVKDEIGEATQYDTAEKPYARPIYFSAGVSVVMATGVGWVEYGPEP